MQWSVGIEKQVEIEILPLGESSVVLGLSPRDWD